jgi:hypothetical protein
LLANFGMIAWVVTQPQPQAPQYRPAPVPPGVDPLVLLSERGPAPDATPARPQADQAETPVPQVAEAADGATGQPPQTAGEAVSEEPEDERAVDAAGSGQVQVPAESFCLTVGPLPQADDASAVSARLEAHGYHSRVRAQEIRKPAGYWVYMPAMPAPQAHRIVSELDAHGLTDHYIGKQNYISLGIFSQESKAQRHLARIRQLGFDAVLEQRYRTAKEYWLDVDETDVPLAGTDLWTRIQREYADAGVQRVSCE